MQMLGFVIDLPPSLDILYTKDILDIQTLYIVYPLWTNTNTAYDADAWRRKSWACLDKKAVHKDYLIFRNYIFLTIVKYIVLLKREITHFLFYSSSFTYYTEILDCLIRIFN